MELRNLKAPDIFIVSTIISKIGIKEFASCFQNQSVKDAIENGKATEVIGMSVAFEIVGIITANLQKCEQDIYQLISNLSGLKVKEVMDLDGIDFANALIDIIMKNKDFFKLASRFQRLEK